MQTNTKQTLGTIRQMVGCQVSYRGDNGTVVGFDKVAASDWMLRIAMDHGGIAILRTSEIK